MKKLETSVGNSWDNIFGVNQWNTGAQPGSNEWSLGLGGQNSDKPKLNIESDATDGHKIYKIESSMDLMIGEWHHLAGVRSGSILRLYLDGELVADNGSNPLPDNLSINNAGQSLFFGSSATQSLFSNAIFDDIRIYHIALVNNEIVDLVMMGQAPNHMDSDGDGIFDVFRHHTQSTPSAFRSPIVF